MFTYNTTKKLCSWTWQKAEFVFSYIFSALIGVNGINHGIEIHGDVVDYAMDKVHEFMLQSHAFDR